MGMINFFSSEYINAVSVTSRLFNLIQIKNNTQTIKHFFKQHPEPQTLLAISDCFDRFKVSSQALQLDISKIDFDSLPYPFIAHKTAGKGSFFVVERSEDDNLHLYNDRDKPVIINKEKFKIDWDGVILTAEKSDNSGEEKFYLNKLKHFLNSMAPFAFIFAIVGVFYILFQEGVIAEWSWPLLLVKVFGLGISVLLIAESLGLNNALIANLCSVGGKNGCNVILKSDSANITEWLSWSDVGLLYFCCTTLVLIISPDSILVLAWLNVLVLPYSVYSAVYQFKNKTFCLLCSLVQVTLWSEFLVNLYQSSFMGGFPDNILPISFGFLLPVILWSYIRPLLQANSEVIYLKNHLAKFKNNFELFNTILVSQPQYHFPEELKALKFGNPDSNNIITMVSNPFCQPCGKTHKKLKGWIENNPDLQVKVVFSTPNIDNDVRSKVARHLTALAQYRDVDTVEKALEDWYANSSFDLWSQRFPVEFNGEITKSVEKQKNWCIMADIAFTPTIFINGYKLPDPYSLDDIEYLLN